jgi:hypothetical protein
MFSFRVYEVQERTDGFAANWIGSTNLLEADDVN